MPQFTEDNLQRIIINPFYAITVAPQLTEEHDPPMSEAEWVQANASLIREMGTERWLRQLLDVLEGKAVNPEEPINPFQAVNIDPMFAADASPAHRTGHVGRRQRHSDTQHGGRGMAQAVAGRPQRRHRDGGGGRLRTAGRPVRVRRTRQI